MQINRTMRYVATLILAAATIVACKKDSDSWTIPYKYSVTVVNDIIGYNQTSNIISTQGDINTTLIAQIDSSTAEWCSFDKNGQLNSISAKPGSDFTIYTQVNNSGSERTATITVTFANGNVMTATFTQLAKSDNADYNRYWGEQPEMNDSNPNYIHKTYYTTIGKKEVRNYSICFDTEKRVSHWVAYPIHKFYTDGKSGRSDAWAYDDAKTAYQKDGHQYYDYIITSTVIPSPENPAEHVFDSYTYPIIPHEKQQNIEAGSYGDQSVVRNLQRGHMLPSYSRQTSWETNAQTFYATNMMPQNGWFNSGVWAILEDAVRRSTCTDTLYVVVGTLFEKNAKQINSRNRSITVPSHCFKLMLRTKSGNTGKRINDISDASQLQAIGFLFENEDIYVDPNKESDAVKKQKIRQAACSIKELEERSGFTFFRNLNPAIADKVKSTFDTNDWSAVN